MPLPAPEPDDVLLVLLPELEVSVEALLMPDVEPELPLLDEPVGAGPVKPSATAALSLGEVSPKPQPPSRSCAIIAPAHFPDLKPQQPDAQSASLVQAPVMNWVPAPVDPELDEEEDEEELLVSPLEFPLEAPLLLEVPGAPTPVNPRATAASSLGEESPKPHPPSRSWAITAPAHFPDLKPQQPEAQSASLVQTPVMN